MAVTSCTFHVRELPKRAIFSAPADAVYINSYLIATDDPTDDQYTVAAQATSAAPDPLPAVGAQFDTDANSFVKRIELTQTRENAQHWIAIVTYEPREPGEEFDANPLDRAVVDWWESEDMEVEKQFDKNGAVIINHAGMPFPEKIIATESDQLLVLKKNYATRAEIDDLNDTFKDTVNDATWYNKGARTWRYRRTVCSPRKTENGIDYYEGKTYISFNPDTWDVNKTEVGFEHLDAAAGDLQRPVGKDGLQLPDPVKLDTDGTRLADGDAALLSVFELYTPMDYSTMGLGGT